MNVNKDRLHYLLKAYMEDTLTKEGFQELGEYIANSDKELEVAIDELWLSIDMDNPLPIASELMYQRILKDPKVLNDPFKSENTLVKANVKLPWKILGGVAAVLCIAFSFFLYFSSNPKRSIERAIADVNSLPSIIVPGSNKAMLILDDGRLIDLDEASVGNLEDQIGLKVVKAENGSVYYETDRNIISNTISYHTIQTPKGGQYQLTLPDGTKVWLNAASKLHYPTRFIDSTRVVELVGEAYFEVNSAFAENGEKIPFIVKNTQQSVEVLGTHFNINNYNGISKTTLLEGSVRVSVNNTESIKGSSRILKPNQQSLIELGDDQIQISTIDPSLAIAWKNNYFAFHREKITDVMATIARWYDVEVIYESDMSNKVFGGTLSRFESFEKVLKTIELTGSVRFKIEGRRVIVMN